jgi:prepilin-type N-terminal cleavage/methylation domain-containing protein
MSKNTKRGFTLIELLVVIAIIGILSAIVLASLSTARNKAQDAKIQGQLSSMRSAAEIYYSTANTYGTAATCAANMFTDTASGMAGLVAAIPNVRCGSNGTAWAAASVLVSNASATWCVDSTGASRLTGANGANTMANGVYVCN